MSLLGWSDFPNLRLDKRVLFLGSNDKVPRPRIVLDVLGEIFMEAEMRGKLVELLRSRGIAAMGTTQGGWPLVSMVLYGPATDLASLYIHVSHLAQHTSALLAAPKVGLMISERDHPTTNPLSIARVSIQGIAETLAVNSAEYAAGRAAYLQAHPKAELNFSLGGFHLVRIRPNSARFVAGFGRIVDIDAQTWAGLAKP